MSANAASPASALLSPCRAAGCAATPRKRLGVELVEANVLAGARAQLSAIAVALGEADGAAGRQCAAALHAHGFVERARHFAEGAAVSVAQRDERAAAI